MKHPRRTFPLATLAVGLSLLFSAVPAAHGAEAPEPRVLEAEQSRVDAIARASAAAIGVFGPDASGGGSGVVITPDGYALTNYHVAQPSGDYMQCTMPDGQLYDAVIVGVDPTGDVALIKLLGRDDFPTATLGDSDKLRVGDWCFTVGNPFLLATDFQPSVAFGIVSGIHRYQYPAGTLLEYADCIQTDAAINPGNSGGPLFNAQGELVGINGRGSFEKRGRVNVGVGYAISINQIKHFLGCLKSGRIVDHATLGATVTSDESGRVLVTNFLETSDAYRRGLRYNDEIVSLGNRMIDSPNAFKNVLGIYPQGWRIPLSYRRDGQRYDILVRLSGVHRTDELLTKISGGVPEHPSPQPQDPPKQQPNGPKEDPPTPQPEGEPELPRPIRRLQQMMRRPKLPDAVAAVLETKRGFANYYFNRLNRDRVWSSFGGDAMSTSATTTANGTTPAGSKQHPEWVVRGQLADRGPFEILLRDREAFLDGPDGSIRLDLTGDFQALVRQRLLLDGRVVEDIGMDHGLLLALSMWRRLLLEGPERFGDVIYWGTAPLPNHDSLVDVVVGIHDVVENRFWFDPVSGGMLGVEAYYDVHRDPVELYFSQPTHFSQARLPEDILIRMGEDSLAIQALTFGTAENGN